MVGSKPPRSRVRQRDRRVEADTADVERVKAPVHRSLSTVIGRVRAGMSCAVAVLHDRDRRRGGTQ